MSDNMYVDPNELGAKLFSEEVIGDMVNNHGTVGGSIDEKEIQKRMDRKNAQAAEAKRAARENRSVFSDEDDYEDESDDDSTPDWSKLFSEDEESEDDMSDITGERRESDYEDDEPVYTVDNAKEFFRDLPDSAEIAPGITKGHVDNALRDIDTTRKNADTLKFYRENFDKGTEAINDHFGLGFVEAQLNIKAIQAKKNDPSTDAYTRGILDKDLEKWQGKGDRMAAKYAEIKRAREFQEQQNINAAVYEANMIMKEKTKGRFDPYEVYGFAKDAGLSNEAIAKTVMANGPAILEILADAKAMRELRKRDGKRLNEVVAKSSKAPTSTRGNPVRTDVRSEKEVAKREFQKKVKKGGYNSKEAFAFLID